MMSRLHKTQNEFPSKNANTSDYVYLYSPASSNRTWKRISGCHNMSSPLGHSYVATPGNVLCRTPTGSACVAYRFQIEENRNVEKKLPHTDDSMMIGILQPSKFDHDTETKVGSFGLPIDPAAECEQRAYFECTFALEGNGVVHFCEHTHVYEEVMQMFGNTLVGPFVSFHRPSQYRVHCYVTEYPNAKLFLELQRE